MAVDAGAEHVLLATDTGDLYGLGAAAWGELGQGATAPTSTAVLVQSGVVSFGVGLHMNLTLRDDGSVMTWGLSGNAQHGVDGAVWKQTDAPDPVPGVSDLTGFPFTLAVTVTDTTGRTATTGPVTFTVTR